MVMMRASGQYAHENGRNDNGRDGFDSVHPGFTSACCDAQHRAGVVRSGDGNRIELTDPKEVLQRVARHGKGGI